MTSPGSPESARRKFTLDPAAELPRGKPEEPFFARGQSPEFGRNWSDPVGAPRVACVEENTMSNVARARALFGAAAFLSFLLSVYLWFEVDRMQDTPGESDVLCGHPRIRGSGDHGGRRLGAAARHAVGGPLVADLLPRPDPPLRIGGSCASRSR